MITSIKNDAVRDVIALSTQHKARQRDNRFVQEGIKLYRETPKELIEKIFISESFDEEILKGIPMEKIQRVRDFVFEKIADTKTPQGILCVIKKPGYTLESILKTVNPFLVLLEDVQDPGNVGTILRTAQGCGVSGVILSKGCADIYSPKVVRSTAGAIYKVPFVYEEDLVGTIDKLKEKGISLYGTHIKGDMLYSKIQYGKGVAILMGNEGNGISNGIAKKCDTLVKIPMKGGLESLNVAVAAALLMYKVLEERS